MDPDASKDVEMADATAIAAPPHQVGNPFTFTVKFHTLGYVVTSTSSAAYLLLHAFSFTFADLPA